MRNARDIETRIGQEMARCEQQHETAQKELREHHADMTAEEQRLTTTAGRLRRRLQPLFDDGGKLTPELAKVALAYLEVLARLQRVRQARRLAFTGDGAIA